MIRHLRSRHRTLALMAAAAAPAVFVLALMDRKPVPLDGTPLTVSQREAPSTIDEVGRRDVTVGDAVLSAALHEPADASANVYLTLARRDAGRTGPDVLVYWQSTAGTLSTDALLLGPLPVDASQRLDLPTPTPTGHVVFYSLAHQDVLASL
ncbi:MAG: hypothetical protein AAFU65_03120, partial [Pseudomonadota bacterium]